MEPAGQLLKGGRNYEYEQRARAPAAHLGRALDLNVQQHVDARVQPVLDGLQGGAVVVIHILSILQQLVGGDHPLKLRPVHKIVIHPVLFTHPGLPGSVGHGEIDVVTLAEQLGDDGALAHT